MTMFALAAVVVVAEPAAAGGSWLSPVRDRYEPGETATLVGYVGPGGTLGTVEDGPFFAYLRRLDAPLTVPNDLAMAPFAPQASDLRLGELAVQNTGRPVPRVPRQHPVPVAKRPASRSLRSDLLQRDVHEGTQRPDRRRDLRRT
jgi:hypothetical protein